MDGCNRLSTLAGLEVGDLAGEDVVIRVVDNAPSGEASNVSDGHRASLRVALHFAEERLLGISFARNRAVTEALGRGADFVAFIDDDDVPDVDRLLRLLEAPRCASAQMILGYWQTGDPSHVPEWLREINLAQADFQGDWSYKITSQRPLRKRFSYNST
jgi:glycosyltransferase involved in cell wall biosynthesis